jgi:hypothetical protein
MGTMSEGTRDAEGRRERRVVGRLLAALDRALVAVREVEAARAELDRIACGPRLRLVGQAPDEGAARERG